MRRLAWPIFITILVLLLGCAPSVLRQPASLQLTTLSEWPEVYLQNFHSLHTLQSTARITVESPEMATNFTAQLIYAAPDTFFLSAEGPLGLDIGKIFIGRNRFIVYNQFNNQFFSGSLDDNYYSTFLQTDLTFRQIKNALVGFVPLPEDLKLVDSKHGVFSAAVNENKWRFEVEPQTGILQKFEIVNNGQVTMRQEFKNYRFVNRILLPGLIRVILPLRKEMVAIFHKNFKINEQLNPDVYHIEIGPKVKQLIISG